MADETVFLCGGARGRGTALRLDGPRRNVGLHLEGIDAKLPAAFVDLIELAAYVEAAETRGARRYRIVMPFREPDVFRDPAVFVPLQRTLSALSGDEYRIEPRERTTRDRGLLIDPAPLPRGRLEVVPFSGGLDSFAGALRLVRQKRNVVLVAQRTSPRIEPFVRKLVDVLKREGGERVSFVPVWHEREGRAIPRTRGFLYAAVSGAISALAPRSSVRFFENGVVSLGLPLSAAGLTVPVSRVAHPRVLVGWQKLFSALAGRAIAVDNGFLFTTKAEVVRGLRDDGGEPMIASTVSCLRRAPRPHTHCGLCAQCIDRRFATLAADAAAADPSSLYAVDLLTGERPLGEPRAVLEAYVRAASEIARASDQELFAQHGELARVLAHIPGTVDETATKLVDLHRRHAAEVEEVIDTGIRAHATELRRGDLPQGSLLMLALPPKSALDERPTLPERPRKPAPPGLVRIVHLSDLHFSKRRAWDQDPVLAALSRDAARLRDEDGPPDFVAITGDVADRGAPEEYALAARYLREQLLPACGVPPERVLLVPGNHDVDRSSVKRVAQAAQNDLLRSESQEAIAAILNDPAERAPLLRRHDAWLAFVDALGAPHDALPWWSRTFSIGAIQLHVAGLCSSWTAWCDEDKGRLLVGRAQLHQVLDGAERAHLSVALVHHPWDYLADFDAAEVREALHRRCDVLLRGHLHKGEGAARIRPDGGSLELAAGASWGGAQHPHGYQWIALDPAKGIARVHLRTWDGHDWIADRNAYRGAAPDGIATFPLRARHHV
jgi:predicted MPP superfamily phosphohydrolase